MDKEGAGKRDTKMFRSLKRKEAGKVFLGKELNKKAKN